jgi:hypothetical protein
MKEPEQRNEGELILYQTQEGAVRIEVLYESETFWLNQKKIAELFGVDLRTISEHLQNTYASGELTQQATLRKIRRVQREGNREVSREIEFYNLDAIISVGYRVNSAQATRFRIWATQTLREFVIKLPRRGPSSPSPGQRPGERGRMSSALSAQRASRSERNWPVGPATCESHPVPQGVALGWAKGWAFGPRMPRDLAAKPRTRQPARSRCEWPIGRPSWMRSSSSTNMTC